MREIQSDSQTLSSLVSLNHIDPTHGTMRKTLDYICAKHTCGA